MTQKKFEVTLEKVERIRIVVAATDTESARLVALEKERRGEADAAEDVSVAAVGIESQEEGDMFGSRRHRSADFRTVLWPSSS